MQSTNVVRGGKRLNFVSKHLTVLRSITHLPQREVGGNLKNYTKSIIGDSFGTQDNLLPGHSVSRQELFKLVADTRLPTFTCCAAILGWGGMRRDHARRAFNFASEWMPIADRIRRGELSRMSAYKHFILKRQTGSLEGMGPAFFTKLIYFFTKNSESRGYIMDQWTARSANLLLGKELIDISRTKSLCWVTDKNTEFVYDEFCDFIQLLAEELGVETDTAEEMIFSVGAKGRAGMRGPWRNYVIKYG